MKKLLLAITAVLAVVSGHAQSTFPTNGNNVGIGTLSPNTILDIFNSGNTSRTLVRISGSQEAPGSLSGILLGAGGLKGRGKGAVFFQPYGTNYGFGKLHFAVNETLGESEADLADVKMTILGNGNIGIGTTVPYNRLEVNGGTRLGGDIDYSTSTVLSIAAGTISFDAPGEPGKRFTILGSNGNVGIGTVTPDAKLTVKGAIHTQEVKVDMNGWSDYVFKPSYKLLSLKQVTTYINDKGHLPEMPSEKEVKEQGVDVGEMLKLQTKKIEELTLYLIEKDKQVEEQNKRLKQQEIRLAALETQLKGKVKR